MRKLILSMMILAAASICSAAQPKLKFDENGEFKILHLTDIHYIHGNPKSIAAIENIHNVINAEHPDLIIITGDMIFGRPGLESIQDVMAAISSHNIPFATTFGNHDDEQGLSRAELYDIIRKTANNINPERGDSPSPDYAISVTSSDGSKTAAVLYCLDSNAYSKVEGVKGYGWFSPEQIEWYCNTSKTFTLSNGGKPVTSLAFFHIPLPEYAQAFANPSIPVMGTRMEAGGEPKLNSGMFTHMKECGDILGIFTGHDHDNDYVLKYYDICLAYGRFSGCSNVYNHLPNGGRVIVLKENERCFDTYIRQRDGAKVQEVSFPKDLALEKNLAE